MKQEGTIKQIGEEQIISDKFKIRTLWIETGGDYPQTVEFQAANDKCNLLGGLTAGQQVTIHFDLRGREWQNKEGETKVFNTLNLWKVESEEF